MDGNNNERSQSGGGFAIHSCGYMLYGATASGYAHSPARVSAQVEPLKSSPHGSAKDLPDGFATTTNAEQAVATVSDARDLSASAIPAQDHLASTGNSAQQWLWHPAAAVATKYLHIKHPEQELGVCGCHPRYVASSPSPKQATAAKPRRDLKPVHPKRTDRRRYQQEPAGYDSAGVAIVQNAPARKGPGRPLGSGFLTKAERDLNALKRNLRSYILFQNHAIRDKVQHEKPGRSKLDEMTKLTSDLYRNLAPEERAHWDGFAAKDKARFDAEMTLASSAPFPVKLHQMLDKVEADGLSDVVSWQPHGRCFLVHKHWEFVERVLPKHFKETKWASFQRQLNLYGFTRLSTGLDKGGYYHKLFLRDKPLLCYRIRRMKVKGTRVRKPADPDHEPNFYADNGAESSGGRYTCSEAAEILRNKAAGSEDCRDAFPSMNKDTRGRDCKGTLALNAKALQSKESETNVKRQSPPRQQNEIPLVTLIYEEACGEYHTGTPRAGMDQMHCQREESERTV